MVGDSADRWPLSPGAERVVTALNAPAAGRHPGCVTGIQILYALWQDESRAAETLKTAGFDAPNTGTGTSQAPPEDLSGHGDVLPAVLRTARHISARSGEGEIGTEHLLAALLDVDANVRDLLADFDIAGLLAEQGDRDMCDEPLEFDDELSVEVNPVPGGRSPATPAIRDSPLTSPRDPHRILDAAANRGREGLRVVEDHVRFRLNDAHLSMLLKTLRHELAESLSRLGSDDWHQFRDTAGDVGTDLGTPQERVRSTFGGVLRANCKRVEESLRSLEEFGKLIDAGAAGAIEQLRYRFYTIEKAVLTTTSSLERLASCRLYLLGSENECRQGFERTVREALAGGVDVVQLREKGGDDRRLLELAHQVRDWTREAGALFILNDRPDIAVLTNADGVHVGQEDLPCQEARKIVGSEQLVGVSTHSIVQARQAVLDGADYIGVGPVFASHTKQFEDFAGLDYVGQVAAEIALPSFAIGGIDESSIGDVMAAGASRVAVSRSVCGATDIRSTVEMLSRKLGARE